MNENQIQLAAVGGSVANQFPSVRSNLYRLAIIGEAPGGTEVETGVPFSGASGKLLDTMLGNAGLSRDCCFVGNICQIRPPANNINAFQFTGPEIQEGMKQLQVDLAQFQPNLCLLLGQTALFAASGEPRKISDWRGSLFVCNRIDSPFYSYKCMASFHPAHLLHQKKEDQVGGSSMFARPLLKFDLKRAREEAESSTLILPQRNLIIDYSPDQLIHWMESVIPDQELSVDIEGGVQQGMSCLSLSVDPLESVLIPFGIFSVWDEARVWRALANLLQNPEISKCLQNGLYDLLVLAYKYHILVRNLKNDTMLKTWEIYSELPKSLGMQTSIFTKEPYYKFERKLDDLPTKHRYCCKDSAVTLEISNTQDRSLSELAEQHYQFNMALLRPLLYMQLRGWNFDSALAREKTTEVKHLMDESLSRIRTHAGFELNPRSPQQVANFLYKLSGLPTQYKKVHGRLTTSVTTDTNALLSLGKSKTYRLPVLTEILTYRRLGKLLDVTQAAVDTDGRMRCSYNLVGTETGRLSCSESATGSGFNLQTVTKKLRVLFRADPGHFLFQCDLSGADGWTVAAHSAALGDSTMLDDYYGGLKPAKIIALFYEKPDYTTLSRSELLEACSEVDPDGWLYFACKRVQHGTNYELGKITMADQIMKDSFKYLGRPIYVPAATCERLQRLYLSRYRGVQLWKNWVKRQVLDKGYLVSASGHTRKLFGRRRLGADVDHATFREALSNEPQENTTYATNLALSNLWFDHENRSLSGSVKIQPVHHGHDALIGQFPQTLVSWALPKIRGYFNNTIKIAGIDIVIPFEGGYGPDWGNCKTPI